MSTFFVFVVYIMRSGTGRDKMSSEETSATATGTTFAVEWQHAWLKGE
jgi:hypothetical protein